MLIMLAVPGENEHLTQGCSSQLVIKAHLAQRGEVAAGDRLAARCPAVPAQGAPLKLSCKAVENLHLGTVSQLQTLFMQGAEQLRPHERGLSLLHTDPK